MKKNPQPNNSGKILKERRSDEDHLVTQSEVQANTITRSFIQDKFKIFALHWNTYNFGLSRWSRRLQENLWIKKGVPVSIATTAVPAATEYTFTWDGIVKCRTTGKKQLKTGAENSLKCIESLLLDRLSTQNVKVHLSIFKKYSLCVNYCLAHQLPPLLPKEYFRWED